MKAWLKRSVLLAVVAVSMSVLLSSGVRPSPARAAAPRFFPETGYSIDDPRFIDFFDKRGGVNTFGYPVSREFTLLGYPVQMFQRAIMQRYPDGHVALMNLLDNGMFPYSKVNGADFPSVDIAMVATAPPPTTPGYDLAILNWVSHNAPDKWNGIPVAFHRTFMNTVSARAAFPTGHPDQSLVGGFDLEIWGVPTSRPAYDPHDKNFVYERFQRGICIMTRTRV